MDGDRFELIADSGGLIQSFVEALQRFPHEPKWCVVGGFAVNIRISEVHRFTNDLDTVSRSQAKLVDALAAQSAIDRVSAGKVRITSGSSTVDIDIMAEPPSHRCRSTRGSELLRLFSSKLGLG